MPIDKPHSLLLSQLQSEKMFVICLLFELSVALDCNQFRIRENVELSQESRIKVVRKKDIAKEVCS